MCGSDSRITLPRSVSTRGCRRGFTLIEVLLVMALLVAFAAFSWPAVESSLRSMQLQKTADRLCTAWGNARLSAMTEGAIYVFRFQPGGSSYQVGPWGDADLTTPSSQTEPTVAVLAAEAGSETTSPLLSGDRPSGQLPSGIVFGTPLYEATPGSTGSDAELSGSSESDMILFYPDGTTSDVTISLQNEQQFAVTIALRGITGASQVGPLISADEIAW
jgi:prepilin-type N-terminal cleavage/methylation domain-containing protein